MEHTYLGQEMHELILGEKLNGFRSPRSKMEKDAFIQMAKDWIKQNPHKHLHFYHENGE